MDPECFFCFTDRQRIFENDYFYSIFDVHPVSPGHALVIPKDHVVSLIDLNKEQWISLKDIIRETINSIERTNFKQIYEDIIKEKPTDKSDYFCNKMLNHIGISKIPEGYNIGNNDGEVAGRTIHHLHIQIIPRYKGDIENPRGGIRNIIPGMGDYLS